MLQVLPLSSVLMKMTAPAPIYMETYTAAIEEQLDIVNSETEKQEEQQQEIEEGKLGWDH